MRLITFNLFWMIRPGFSHIPTDQPHRQAPQTDQKPPVDPRYAAARFRRTPRVQSVQIRNSWLRSRTDRPTGGHGAAAVSLRVDALTDVPISERKVQIYRIKADVQGGQPRACWLFGSRRDGPVVTERKAARTLRHPGGSKCRECFPGANGLAAASSLGRKRSLGGGADSVSGAGGGGSRIGGAERPSRVGCRLRSGCGGWRSCCWSRRRRDA